MSQGQRTSAASFIAPVEISQNISDKKEDQDKIEKWS